MKTVEYYKGREQTYIKHFFLERYLERVAYNIGSFANRFVYIDGFSGPWRSENEASEDTSFVIALNKLREVKKGLQLIEKRPEIRCLFIEKDARAFADLTRTVQGVSDLEVHTLNGEFEHLIPDVLRFIRQDFALTFVDPTGWKGFGLDKISPLLQHRGEVIVNFMFDHINRFLDHPDQKVTATFDSLFGGQGWGEAVAVGERREERIIEFYQKRLQAAGGFRHVTSTRILKPISDRAYFYLIYGTRHQKGILEFRNVERKAVEEQERVRIAAKTKHRISTSRQTELFNGATLMSGPSTYEREKAVRLDNAKSRLVRLLKDKQKILYEEARAFVLALPLVWELDFKEIILELRSSGDLVIEGMASSQRSPQPGHVLKRGNT